MLWQTQTCWWLRASIFLKWNCHICHNFFLPLGVIPSTFFETFTHRLTLPQNCLPMGKVFVRHSSQNCFNFFSPHFATKTNVRVSKEHTAPSLCQINLYPAYLDRFQWKTERIVGAGLGNLHTHLYTVQFREQTLNMWNPRKTHTPWTPIPGEVFCVDALGKLLQHVFFCQLHEKRVEHLAKGQSK